MESRHFRTGQNNILLSRPQCLDSMLAPGLMNLVYTAYTLLTGEINVQSHYFIKLVDDTEQFKEIIYTTLGEG